MSNDLVLANIPTYLTQYVDDTDSFDEFKVPAGSIGSVSLDGKKFTFKYGQNEMTLADPSTKFPMQFLDCVIISANNAITKTFYDKPMPQNSGASREDTKPVCTSLDGVRPEPGVAKPQSEYCKDCRWNKYNVIPGRVGKPCQDNKRVVIVPAWDIENEQWGGPMLLRLPPTSFAPFDQYIASFKRASQQAGINILPYRVITRLSFDPVAKFALNFTRMEFLDEPRMIRAKAWRQDERTDRVLHISSTQVDRDGGAEEHIEAPPAAPSAQTAADAQAAARAAQQTVIQPAPAPVSTPAPAPVNTAPASAPAPVANPAPAMVAPQPAPAPVQVAPAPAAPPAPVSAPAPTGASKADLIAQMEATLAEIEVIEKMPTPLPASAAVKKRMLDSRLEKLSAEYDALEAQENAAAPTMETQPAVAEPAAVEEGDADDIINALDKAMAGGYELPE